MGVFATVVGFVVIVLMILFGCKYAYDHLEWKKEPKE